MVYKLDGPIFHKIQSFTLHGTPLDPEKEVCSSVVVVVFVVVGFVINQKFNSIRWC